MTEETHIIPTPAQLAGIPLYHAIPQRPPIVMIDALTDCGETTAESVYTVKDDCIFLDGGKLNAYGMIENVAQTCAARIGYYAVVNNMPVRIGYIGAFSGMSINGHPAVGQMVRTRISVTNEVFNMLLVDAVMTVDGSDTPLLTTTMKIALSDIEAHDS